MICDLKFFYSQMAEGHGIAVILQADATGTRKVFIRDIEFVVTAVRILVGRGPVVEVQVNDGLTIEDYCDKGTVGRDGLAIPLACRFDRH